MNKPVGYVLMYDGELIRTSVHKGPKKRLYLDVNGATDACRMIIKARELDITNLEKKIEETRRLIQQNRTIIETLQEAEIVPVYKGDEE